MTGEVDELHRRIAQLEDWRRELDISRAREDESRKHFDARFDALERRITQAVNWFLTSVGGAILAAAVAFVINGGLAR